MNSETFFLFLSYCSGPFWLLVLFAPQNKIAMLAVDLFLFTLSGLFVFLTFPVLSEVIPLVLEPTYQSMHRFLSTENGFMGRWNHLILGDVWIDRWIAEDTLKQFTTGKRALLARLLFIPWVLALGPFGLFFYLLFRFAFLRRFHFNAIESSK